MMINKTIEYFPVGARLGLKGKPVASKIRHGPAAVTGDETCSEPLLAMRQVGRRRE
jgi:hypothetical protein